MVADPMLVAAQSQVSAAWVQAWGSVLAILAAALIASAQARREAKVRKDAADVLARDHAMRIDQPVRAWAEQARAWVKTLNDETGTGESILIGTFGDDPASVGIPPLVLAMKGELRHLGAAAHPMQRAIVAWDRVDAYRGDMRAWWHGRKNGDKSHVADAHTAVELIRRYAGAVSAAGTEIERIRGG